MDAKTLDVIDGAVQSVDFHFATVAGAGIHLTDVQRAAEDRLDARPELPADGFESFRFPRRFQQTMVRAVVIQAILGRMPQLVAQAGGEFANIGHADGRVYVSAQPAEDAFAEVECDIAADRAARRLVDEFNGAGGADGGGGPGVLPLLPIDLRPAARTAGNFRRRCGIDGGDGARFPPL